MLLFFFCRIFFNFKSLMDWLHQAQTARQNHAKRSQMKKLLVPSGFLDQKFYALATPRPRQPDKIMPDRARQKIAGSIWFPGPKIWRKIEGSWPDWARQHQILSLFVNKVKFWRCLVQSGQLPSSFLQTSSPGSQTEPATFSSGSVWHDFVWLSGLGVASP